MEWEFAPEQVVKGEVSYSVTEFRRDLRAEVLLNLAGDDPAQARSAFDLLYDFCYWLATGRQQSGFVAQFRHTLEKAVHHRGHRGHRERSWDEIR